LSERRRGCRSPGTVSSRTMTRRSRTRRHDDVTSLPSLPLVERPERPHRRGSELTIKPKNGADETRNKPCSRSSNSFVSPRSEHSASHSSNRRRSRSASRKQRRNMGSTSDHAGAGADSPRNYSKRKGVQSNASMLGTSRNTRTAAATLPRKRTPTTTTNLQEFQMSLGRGGEWPGPSASRNPLSPAKPKISPASVMDLPFQSGMVHVDELLIDLKKKQHSARGTVAASPSEKINLLQKMGGFRLHQS
jgi:hypothetical protein